MKLLFKIEARRGHGEFDYVFKVSPIELQALKRIIIEAPRIKVKNKKTDKLKGGQVSISKCLGSIKLKKYG